MKEIEQIKAWAVLMYREIDEQLDADWVYEQLNNKKKSTLAKPWITLYNRIFNSAETV